MKPLRRLALLFRTLIYLVAVALFFEGASRGFLLFAFPRVAGNDEASWRLRFVQRKRGNLPYSFDVPDPNRGWALRPGLSSERGSSGSTVSSTSTGIRGRREYGYAKPAGVKRIVVLGDSFTFGEDVSDDETYAARLEQSLPGVEVLNLGVHGYGHDQMLLYLEEEGLKYHPDVVLLGFLYDDMERNLLGFRDYAKPRFELEGGSLVLRNSPVPPPQDVLAAERYRSKFLDLFTMLGERWASRSGSRERTMRRLTQAILDRLNRSIREAGARAAYAYLPVYGEIDRPDLAMTHHEHFFFSYCRDRGIQSIYLQPFFLEKKKAGARFKTFGHWGPLEHQTVAEGLRAYLEEKGLLEAGS